MKKILLAGFIGLSSISCGKKEKAQPPPLFSETQRPKATGTVTQSPNLPALPFADDQPVDLARLNKALRLYYLKRPGLPKDLDELVTAKVIPYIPDPPPGKKFAIDRDKVSVVVVNQ